MAAITLPNHPIVTNTVTDASQLSEWLYDPQLLPATPNSFEVVNGWLSSGVGGNVRASSFDESVTRGMTQRGSLVQASAVGGTANLDYFASWYAGVDMDDEVDEDIAPRDDYTRFPGRHIQFPGGGLEFYLPWDNAVTYFSWNVSWSGDSDDDDEKHSIRLFVDGSAAAPQRRDVRMAIDTGIPAYRGDRKTRIWAGHFPFVHTQASRGWHRASLRLLMHGGTGLQQSQDTTRQTRIRLRGFRRISFKKNNT